MTNVTRRSFVKLATQATSAAVAGKLAIKAKLVTLQYCGDAAASPVEGCSTTDALARMKPWLLEMPCLPVKDPHLLEQIHQVHVWAKKAFQLESHQETSPGDQAERPAPSPILRLSPGHPLSLRLPEPGQSLQLLVNIAGAPAAGAHRAVFVVVHEFKSEIFRSPDITGTKGPVALKIGLAKTREISISVESMPATADEPLTVELTSGVVELTNGRMITIASTHDAAGGIALSAEAEPFSFIYNGQNVRASIGKWKRHVRRTVAQDHIQYALTYSDPATQLEVRCDLKLFTHLPAVHWVLHFTNRASTDTPLIENILPLDVNLTLPIQGRLILHHSNGSWTRADGTSGGKTDFLPFQQLVNGGERITFAPAGGRSSSPVLPFFNLQWAGRGMAAAIGWTGQWSTGIYTDAERCASWQAGQQTTRLKLHPGESIRTPSILLLPWAGDTADYGSNLLRRLLLQSFVARIEDKVAVPPVSMTHITVVNGSQKLDAVTESNQLAAIKTIAGDKMGVEVFWLDAGWMQGGFQDGVGNWTNDSRRFPHGLRPLANAANKRGMQFLLWFEPERVMAGSDIARAHPEWLLHDVIWGTMGLFNLADANARRWMTDLLADRIKQWNIGILRQDCNITPLPFWRTADAPDRIGITEIRYIEGLYAMWDELRKRFPLLAIDCCASGGRRIDIESIQRCFYLWQSDMLCYGRNHADWCQTEHTGLSKYIPTSGGGAGNANFNIYDFRSAATSGIVLYMPETPEQAALLRKAIAELKMLRPLYLGDSYNLTSPTSSQTADTHWTAWQFDRPETGRGFAMFFRRSVLGHGQASFELRNLEAKASYLVKWTDSNCNLLKSEVRTGEELRKVDLEIKEPRGSCLLVYSRKNM